MTEFVTNETPYPDPKTKELIFPCVAGCGEYMRIYWDLEDPMYRWMWVESVNRPEDYKFIRRIKTAIKIILRMKVFHSEIELNEGSIKDFRDFLIEQYPVEKEDAEEVLIIRNETKTVLQRCNITRIDQRCLRPLNHKILCLFPADLEHPID